MKKLFLIIMVLVGSIATTNAQTAIETSKFTDNTYVGLSGTVATALKFDPFLPVEGDVSVKLGKWVTPALGFNIEERLGFGTPSLWMYYLTKKAVRTNNLMVNVDVDLFQAIRYKENRKFSMIAEAGLGWLHEYGDDNTDDMSGKTGLIFNWRLGKCKAWAFYFEPEIIWNLTNTNNKPHLYKENGQIGIEVGVNYRFKNKNGTHYFKSYDIGEYVNTIDGLNGTIAALQAELDTIPKVVEVVKEVYINQPTLSRTIVMFAQNSAEIVDTADLDDLARKDSLIHVKVYGYASPEGSKEYNLNLSQKRADNVAAYLTTKGITVDSSEGLGVVGNNSNRVVIVLAEDIYKDTIESNENPHKGPRGKMTAKEFRENTPHDGEPIRDHGRQPGKEKEDMSGPQRH